MLYKLHYNSTIINILSINRSASGIISTSFLSFSFESTSPISSSCFLIRLVQLLPWVKESDFSSAILKKRFLFPYSNFGQTGLWVSALRHALFINLDASGYDMVSFAIVRFPLLSCMLDITLSNVLLALLYASFSFFARFFCSS